MWALHYKEFVKHTEVTGNHVFGLDGPRLIVGLHDLQDLFQLKKKIL